MFTILFGASLPLAARPTKGDTAAGNVRDFAYDSYIFRIAFSPDGKYVLTDDQIWEAATGTKVRTLLLLPLKEREFFSFAFSPDSRHVAIHRYLDLVLVNSATGKELWTVKPPNRESS